MESREAAFRKCPPIPPVPFNRSLFQKLLLHANTNAAAPHTIRASLFHPEQLLTQHPQPRPAKGEPCDPGVMHAPAG